MSTKDVFTPEGSEERAPMQPQPQYREPSDIPSELVPLPSKGKLYSQEHPLHMEEGVEIKAMTAMEENILTSQALIKKGTVTKELVRSCLLNRGIDQSSLLIGDKNAILFAIRISGFGPEYKVQTRCPDCKTKFSHSFMLNKVKIKPLGEEADQVEPGLNLFRFTLPLSQGEVVFSLLTDGDDDEIKQAQDRRKLALRKRGMTSDVDTLVTDRLLKQIKSINGKSDRQFVSSFVQNMRVGDARALREHINKIEPNIDMSEDVRCPECGMMDNHTIPITTEFFWPELD